MWITGYIYDIKEFVIYPSNWKCMQYAVVKNICNLDSVIFNFGN